MREPSLCTRHLPSVLRLHDDTGLVLSAWCDIALGVSLTALQSLICPGPELTVI